MLRTGTLALEKDWPLKMPDTKKMDRTITICDALLALGALALFIWLLL